MLRLTILKREISIRKVPDKFDRISLIYTKIIASVAVEYGQAFVEGRRGVAVHYTDGYGRIFLYAHLDDGQNARSVAGGTTGDNPYDGGSFVGDLYQTRCFTETYGAFGDYKI